jgi:hypothetical protein
MALAYRPPSVSINEVVTPNVAPLLAAPAQICLVGLSQGYQQRTDQFVLTGTDSVRLPRLPQDSALQSVESVNNATNPVSGGYDAADYVISLPNGTITRATVSNIESGALINVTYRYVPNNYYEPIRLNDFGSIESRFGSALTSDGKGIFSRISYASSIAFENGAREIVLQPLFTHETPGDETTDKLQPTTVSTVSSWVDTLKGLRDIEDINVIVPVVGQSDEGVGDSTQLAILQAVQDHSQFMAKQYQYVVNVFGEDSSGSDAVAQQGALIDHANILRTRFGGEVAEQTVLINTSKFERSLPSFGQELSLGGQYVAAAVSGMIASRPVSAALTRDAVSGFTSVSDPRSLQEKNRDAEAGLFVIEQKGRLIQVRHALTIDNKSTARRELSVVRAKHRMIESVRDTLERQVIGNVIADGNATSVVESAVIGVLEVLRQGRDLVDYSAVTARMLTLDPTTVQVRFSYRPAFPLNYIDIEFSLDLTSGANFNLANNSALAGA